MREPGECERLRSVIENVVKQESTTDASSGVVRIVSVEEDVRNTIGSQLQSLPRDKIKAESGLRCLAVAAIFTCEEVFQVSSRYEFDGSPAEPKKLYDYTEVRKFIKQHTRFNS